MNPNLKELRRTVNALGGKTLSSKAGAKHFLVSIETPEGKTIRVSLSKSPMRSGHIRLWIRQKFQRARRKPKVKEK